MADITILTIDDLENFINGNLGTGTSSVPLEVELANDLDFSELDDSDSRKWNFRYTGTPTNIYVNFDGKGHKIKNLNYSSDSQDWALFYHIAGKLSNLTLADINIYCNTCYGFVRQPQALLNIENCHVKGVLSARGTCTGLSNSGTANTLNVDRCSVSGELTGTTVYGITQSSNYAEYVSRSYVAANIRATNYAYLLATESVREDNSFFRGNVYGNVLSTAGRIICGSAAKYCYCMIHNASDISAQSAVFNTSATSCFYNNDEFDYGTAAVSDMGTNKENLQSAAFLRAAGYAI